MDYYTKYLKYRNKYLQLKNQIGGNKFGIYDEVERSYNNYAGGFPARTLGKVGKIIKILPEDRNGNKLYSIEFYLDNNRTPQENTLTVAEGDLKLTKKYRIKSLNILDIPKLVAPNTDTDAENFIINNGSDEDIIAMENIFKKHNPMIEPYYIDIREPSMEITALMSQAQRGTLKAMKWLLDNGANINLQSTNGFTPLHWAVLSNNPEKVDFLLHQGVDESIYNKNGETPLELAKKTNKNEVIDLLEKKNIESGDFVAQSGYFAVPNTVYDVVVIDRKSGKEAAVVAFSSEYENGSFYYQNNDDKELRTRVTKNYNGIIQKARKFAIDNGFLR
jgi:hypothetical protein